MKGLLNGMISEDRWCFMAASKKVISKKSRQVNGKICVFLGRFPTIVRATQSIFWYKNHLDLKWPSDTVLCFYHIVS